MIRRELWIKKIEEAWTKKSVIWLAGVRRSGKTTLCHSLPDSEYFDCEFPDVRSMLDNPRLFLTCWKGKRIAIDEIHNLDNPSQFLKIAADYFPTTKIIATGSSTLSATQKFRDTLTDRYTLINLTPMLSFEGELFGNKDIQHRLLFGGLPPFFVKNNLADVDFHSWIDAFWAKDIQELFRIEKRLPFLKFTQLLLAQSGGTFDATRFAHECEVTRGTISNYLSVLETTYLAHIIKPYSEHPATEIKSMPKVYGFDTGFICNMRGWYNLRPVDYGSLWEHIVLNELKGRLRNVRINYWRDKRDHEIDFVILTYRHSQQHTVECKWSYRTFDPGNLKHFRKKYSRGKNFVVCADLGQSFEHQYDNIIVSFVSLEKLLKALCE